MNRSSVCHEGGKTPHWNDTFYFTVTNDPMLRVEVWDDDTCEDDIVGAGSYNLSQYLNQGMDTNSNQSFIQFGWTSTIEVAMQAEFALD